MSQHIHKGEHHVSGTVSQMPRWGGSYGLLVWLQSFNFLPLALGYISFYVWSSSWCDICMSTSCTTRDITIQGTVIKNIRLSQMALGDQTSIWVMKNGGPGRVRHLPSIILQGRRRKVPSEGKLCWPPGLCPSITPLLWAAYLTIYLITPPGPFILDLYKIWSRQKVASLGLSPLDNYLKPCEPSSVVM